MLGSSAVRLESLFVVNLVINLPLFWFAGAISWAKPRFWRVVLVATVGALLALPPAMVPWGGWLVSVPAVLLCSALLALLLTGPCSLRQFGAVFGVLWVGLGVSGGAVMILAERFDLFPGIATRAVALAAGIPLALVILQMVWQAFRERKAIKEVLCPFQVRLGAKRLVLTGLVDSGNSLRTPVSRRPVAVVEADCLRPYLPPEVMEALSMGWDALASIPEEWRNRCQIIPYAAVGTPEGLLLVIAPDDMALWEQGRWVPVGGVIGLSLQPVDPQGGYQALLSPSMLQEAEGK